MFIQIMHVLSASYPDIVVVNKEVAYVQIIGAAVPADCNITSKEAEKVESTGTFLLNLCHCGK